MVRSGSTLQYNVARCLAERTGTGQGRGFLSQGQDQPSEVDEKTLTEWVRDGSWNVIKMRVPHGSLGDLLKSKAVRVCYIYRDLRDVAASVKRALQRRTSSLWDELDRAVASYEHLSTLRADYPEHFLWQRSEAVQADLFGAVRETADLLTVRVDEALVRAVEEVCSVDNAAALCATYRDQIEAGVKGLRDRDPRRAAKLLQELRMNRLYDPDWLLLPDHVSSARGATGSWVGGLQMAELATVMDRYGDWMNRNGYVA